MSSSGKRKESPKARGRSSSKRRSSSSSSRSRSRSRSRRSRSRSRRSRSRSRSRRDRSRRDRSRSRSRRREGRRSRNEPDKKKQDKPTSENIGPNHHVHADRRAFIPDVGGQQTETKSVTKAEDKESSASKNDGIVKVLSDDKHKDDDDDDDDERKRGRSRESRRNRDRDEPIDRDKRKAESSKSDNDKQGRDRRKDRGWFGRDGEERGARRENWSEFKQRQRSKTNYRGGRGKTRDANRDTSLDYLIPQNFLYDDRSSRRRSSGSSDRRSKTPRSPKEWRHDLFDPSGGTLAPKEVDEQIDRWVLFD